VTTSYCLKFETPQPRGSGPRIYILQEKGGPVIPTGTGFPFRCLPWLAGLRWRYSTPPPHGYEWLMNLNLSLILWPTVSRPVCLGLKYPSGAYDQIFITVRHLWVCWYGALSLTRGRVCHLQLLLALASAVILGSESRGIRDHILLSQIWNFMRIFFFLCSPFTTRTCPPFIAWDKPNREHHLEQFLYYCVRIRCHGYMFSRTVV
jgi:hypothetical protein